MDLKLSSYDKDKSNSFYYKRYHYKIGETFLSRKKNLLKEKINEIKGIIKNDRKTEN